MSKNKKIVLGNKMKSKHAAKIQRKLAKRGVFFDYVESKGRVDEISISW